MAIAKAGSSTQALDADMEQFVEAVKASDTHPSSASHLQDLQALATKRRRPALRLSGVEQLKAELEALVSMVHKLRVPDEDDMVHLPLVDPLSAGGQWSAVAPLVPLQGFERLRESRSEAAFLGGDRESVHMALVELAGTEATSFPLIAERVQDCAMRCEQLAMRASRVNPGLSTFQVLALVEHCFLVVVPTPRPRATGSKSESDSDSEATGAELSDSGESDSGESTDSGERSDSGESTSDAGVQEDRYEACPFTLGVVDVDTQRACLRALNDILLCYVAAAKTFWRSDDQETVALRLLTSGCIFAAYDAVLRLQASPTPLHLSAIMKGRAGINPMINEQVQFSASLLDFSCAASLPQVLRQSMLATDPSALIARSRLIEYLDWLELSSLDNVHTNTRLFAWTHTTGYFGQTLLSR